MRFVPIPGELVAILRAHIARYGHAADGRLFRSESGRVLYPSSYRYVWQHARELALTPAQVRSLLARRPYDLRHCVGQAQCGRSADAGSRMGWAQR